MRDTLARRLFLILLVGAVLSAAAALWLSDMVYRQRQAEQGRSDAAERIATALQLLPSGAAFPGVGRASDLMPAGAPDAAFSAIVTSRLGDATDTATVRIGPAQAYRASPETCAPGPLAPPRAGPDARPAPPVRIGAGPRPPGGPETRDCRLVLIQTAKGPLGLTVALPPAPAPLTAGRFGLVFLGVLAVAAAGLAWISARLAVAPLRRLGVAATWLGDDLDRPPLPLDGPAEVREAATAFNVMQARLKAVMADRTRMLAAITHDLQTPLTRMRLRLDKVTDADLRDRLLADFAATQVLIREGLDLAREAEAGEPWGQVDVPSLIEALVEDMADAGLPVSVGETGNAVVRARPQALRRALGNLIDNAIRHGGSAEVVSVGRTSGVDISVLDRGPGIPDDQLDAVLEPFHRLETSRSRDTGGSGLGLTIAVRMAQRTGATLSLHNRPGGGLEARLAFTNPVSPA